MELMCLLLCLLCVGAIAVITLKNDKLIKETHSAKKEYLSAKSNNVRLEHEFIQTRDLLRETREFNSSLREEMLSLKYTVEHQSGLILEQNRHIHSLQERVTDLEYDNKRLKQKLKIHDEVARHSKVVIPFKATI